MQRYFRKGCNPGAESHLMIHFSLQANFHLGIFFHKQICFPLSRNSKPPRVNSWDVPPIFLSKYSSPQKWIYSQHNRHVQNYFWRWMQHGSRTQNRQEWIPNLLRNTLRGYNVMLFYRWFQIILHSNILEYGTLRIYDRPCFWHQKSEKSECFGNISKSTSTLTIS